MALKCGIVGLPNVGKSTLFNCVSSGKAQSANFPFCTIEPNIGSTIVPDKRLEVLESLCNPKRVVPATVEIVDIAGLVKGASKGEGLGNQFLANIRETDAILQRTGRKVSLEPMNPYERRIIHYALQQTDGVDTHSEGEEPNRHVVITQKK